MSFLRGGRRHKPVGWEIWLIPANIFGPRTVVDVSWQKRAQQWSTFKSEGNRLLFHATGGSFEEAMKNTLAVGLSSDEIAR